ncbi:hypothetical protein MXAN_2175 [Myxococcus xanthus DK 1622]|uniref:Lipoprotein n=1 Tax=Myxococcus xanthus (strain DK1622) TaxID=246197 RepID=Q1DAC5_MYXXD|nr:MULTISPECIES: hypothetical protein [Myxococcus]ABF86663.1 hypothetical protein MXAN_2175 [Myxococcus xanthus DK 1622]NOJ57321.1 hypothetical protein [Myxococcus xanthus]QPM81714.1 hypothetical protein I5Q59_10795 [Myxococcus xanthus]QVW70965.1 hypothetical protein JTM82_16155 [Myxococcus xanthus DZ2]QZZ49902.1 hypothetical protein MyxoNM_11910 [Myxococcus xanthus]
MKLGALVLVVLLALPASGSEVISVERAQLFPDGGSAAVEVEGGCWLSESRCIRTASEIARLRAENESLRQQAGDVSFTVAIVALLAGLGAGFAVAKLVER